MWKGNYAVYWFYSSVELLEKKDLVGHYEGLQTMKTMFFSETLVEHYWLVTGSMNEIVDLLAKWTNHMAIKHKVRRSNISFF